MDDELLYEYISKELANFKFTRSSISYIYLIEAIKIVSKNKMVIKDFNKLVYKVIAKKYNTEEKNVNWSISKLLKLMYLNTNEEVIKKYFNLVYDDDKITTKAFIIFIAYKVNFREKKKIMEKFY